MANSRLFPNHSRVTEICEKIGFTTLPYILWKKPTNKPAYKGQRRVFRLEVSAPKCLRDTDCEFILLFRKGNLRKFPPHDKTRYESAFTNLSGMNGSAKFGP